jgi:tRNA uridine 5-carbamoylmethylation protein Kti12
MPLVIVSGHPCVGKTTFANNLLNKLKLVKDPSKIFLINEESLHYEREEFYQGTISSFSSLFSSSVLIYPIDASHEKTLRQVRSII